MARHFIFILDSDFSYLILRTADSLGHVVVPNESQRGQETKAEIKADQAARSAGRAFRDALNVAEKDMTREQAWSQNRHKIAELWKSRFCR